MLAALLVDYAELGNTIASEATKQIASILRNILNRSSNIATVSFAGEE